MQSEEQKHIIEQITIQQIEKTNGTSARYLRRLVRRALTRANLPIPEEYLQFHLRPAAAKKSTRLQKKK